MKTLPIVEVWWQDAEAHSGWEAARSEKPDASHQSPKVRTVGFLISHTKGARGRVVVAHTHSETEVNGKFIIPTGMVLSMRTLMDGGQTVDVYGS